MKLALIGNQNSGKTTLFNRLTGSNQHVGNFPGITVNEKIGLIKNTSNLFLVDLPGIYSLSPYSKEECITRDFLLNEKPDGIINIIDATNLERNLYLTLQLLELNIPIIIALNMMDEVKSNGENINIEKLSKELKTPIIPISAMKNQGISLLIKNIPNILVTKNTTYNHTLYLNSPIYKHIHLISKIIEKNSTNFPPLFCAIKIIENDAYFLKKLKLSNKDIKLIEEIILDLEKSTELDKNLAIGSLRYNFIEKICNNSVIRKKESKQHKRSIIIDKLLTNKYLGIPIFFLIMFLIFFLTFNVIGNRLADYLKYGISCFTILADGLLTKYNITPIIHSLIIDGIFNGIGSVLSFLPIIVVLFFFLSMLEDSGYMARVTILLDKLFEKIGLSGKSFVPMLMGFGCSVPAIMSTRTLPSKKDRKITLLLIPYMSCSAKIPIYAVFCTAFFGKYSSLVMIILYILGILIGILLALLLKDITLYKTQSPLIIELPNYRLPSLKSTLHLVYTKAKEFTEKAFSIIFIASIIIWFLQTFTIKLKITNDPSSSLLAQISRFLTPIFLPLGFGDWRIVTSLISGLSAKETVLSTLSILLNVGPSNLKYALGNFFNPSSAFSFLVFTLLYTPCIGAMATICKELKSPFKTLAIIIFQCSIAWIFSFIFFKIGNLFIN